MFEAIYFCLIKSYYCVNTNAPKAMLSCFYTEMDLKTIVLCK